MGADETLRLLEQWHAGDNDALGALLDRDLGWISSYVHRRLGPDLRRMGDTEDFVQEAVIKVLRHGPRFVLSDREHFRALLGKIVLNLRVVRTDGGPARMPDLVLRNLLRAADALPPFLLFPTFGIGVVTMAFDRRQRRLGDLLAGTVVVASWRWLKGTPGALLLGLIVVRATDGGRGGLARLAVREELDYCASRRVQSVPLLRTARRIGTIDPESVITEATQISVVVPPPEPDSSEKPQPACIKNF